MEPHCLWHAVPWSLDICSTQRSPVHRVQMHDASNRDTHVPAAQQLISFSDNNIIRAAQWVDYQWNMEWMYNPTRLHILIPDTELHPPWNDLPRRAWVRLNHLCTGVGSFRSCLYKWSMAPSATCECGAEEQTVNHVVLRCPIHRLPH